MRKSFLVGLVSLLLVGCSGASTRGTGGPPPPAYYGPTVAPYGGTPGYRYPTPAPAYPAPSPYDGVTYADPGVNQPVDPNRDNRSTFGLDVDTASYTIAQRYIRDGYLPDPASVRIEEFVNFFDQGYAPPLDRAFAIYADGGPSPFLAEDELLLRIGIKARDVHDRVRPAAALTFVVDVSGSMAREDRLELVKRALGLLVAVLRPGDRVAIVAFGDGARVVLQPTEAGDGNDIQRAIDSLHPEGSTNAEAGLRLGYDLARAQFREGGINRVVLASDGVANVGETDPDVILGRVRRPNDTGIQLVTVGFGMGNYNDALMERLADRGDGFYAYVNTLDEARRLFLEDLTGTLDTVALDARVQVEFDPAVVASYRLIGYENRAISDKQFRSDNVQAGAIGAGHSVTALYAVRLVRPGRFDDGGADRIATVNLRWVEPESQAAREIAQDIRGGDLGRSFRDTAQTFRLDALVAATAERFRQSEFSRGYDLRDVEEAAREVADNLPQTDEVRGFLELLRRAVELER